MGWLSKVAGFVTGGTVTTIAKAADEYIHTEEERTNTDQVDLKSARAMQAPVHGTWFDALVDGFSRLIRPGVTLWICGGFAGLWDLPAPDMIDKFWQSVLWVVLTFWFGGRAVMKDIPKMINALRGR